MFTGGELSRFVAKIIYSLELARPRGLALGALAGLLWFPAMTKAVVSVDYNATLGIIDNAIVLNDVVTASALYSPVTYSPTFGGVTVSIPFNNNYGQSSIVAIVDLGLIDNTDPALARVSTYFNINLPTNPASTPPAALVGEHATSVGKFAAGYNATTTDNLVSLVDFGIAPLATIWSGSIVDSGDPNSDANNQTNASTMYPFVQAMNIGVNGQTADAVNASFGAQGVPPSDDFLSNALDGLAKQNPHSTLAVAAGNSGPGAGTVGSPAVGFNNIAVAALASDPTLTYTTASDYSSRGPQGFYNPVTGITVANARPAIDISAPGDYFISSATPITGDPGDYEVELGAGTSFATPMVTGAVAQLAAYAHGLQSLAPTLQLFDPNINQRISDATDSRVMKAVLMNTADKLPGWNNGQTLINGVFTTTQGLDYTYGAGRLDVANAADTYLNGSFDPMVIGTQSVLLKGWDLSTVTLNQPNFYDLGTLTGNQQLNATLDWFADDSYDATAITASIDRFANLNLEVLENLGGGNLKLIAISDSLYNNVQELSFISTDTADYEIGIYYAGVQFAPAGDTTNSETYALAWSAVAVPEPAMLFMLLPVMFGLSRRSR